MKNCITINYKKDKLVIKIEEDAKQEEIVKALERKLPELNIFYKSEKTPINVIGKVLKNKEIDEIENLIKSQIDVDIDFDTPKTLGLSSITRTFKQDIEVSETKFHKGSLRSGQRIESEGSIVVLGDVNSGAEVIASENIVVLGALRGLAHAGAKGNEKAIISAGKLDSVQVRIANIVKEFNRDEEPLRKMVYLYVQDDKIVVE